jgi:hypothetical protein
MVFRLSLMPMGAPVGAPLPGVGIALPAWGFDGREAHHCPGDLVRLFVHSLLGTNLHLKTH